MIVWDCYQLIDCAWLKIETNSESSSNQPVAGEL